MTTSIPSDRHGVSSYRPLACLLALAAASAAWACLDGRETPPPTAASAASHVEPNTSALGALPIDSIRVGQRVWTGGNPTGERDERLGDEVDSSAWRKMTLRAPKRTGGWADVECCGPPPGWRSETYAPAGGSTLKSPSAASRVWPRCSPSVRARRLQQGLGGW